MKEKFKIYPLLSLLSILSVLFFSCQMELGMGEAVDTEAPEITITSPKKNAQVHSKVTLLGTCTDNKKVTSVIVENNDTGELYGYADINGEEWSYTVTLPEGEVTLRCSVTDEAGNSSTKSTKTISLLVDDTAPEGLSWYIERGIGEEKKGNGIPTPFYDLNKLKNEIDISLSVNKDIPQNDKFFIHGRLYDAMTLSTITLVLKDENNSVVAEKTVDAGSIKDNESIYTPTFTFTQSDLISRNASMNSGKHYLKASYIAKDEHGNEKSDDIDYLLWYPESDYPGFEQVETVGSNLSITVGSAIPFTLFDDDGLKDCYYAFLPSTTEVTYDNMEEKLSEFTYEDKSGYRDLPCQVSSDYTKITGVYYLASLTKDVMGKITKKFIKVSVIDSSYPLLIIESPAENSIPSIKSGTTSIFEIKGVSNDTNGSNIIKIAYLLESTTDKDARARELFNGTSTPTNGEILKTYIFPTTKTKENPEDKFYKESFSFEFDVLNDFGSAAKDAKSFVLMVEDNEGNQTFKSFRINGDSNKPEIIVLPPFEDGSVCNYSTQDLVIKFRAEKISGLGIDKTKYKVIRKDEPSVEYTIANGKLAENADGSVSLTIDKSVAKKWAEGSKEEDIKANSQPVFILKAADVLGNDITRQVSIVLTPLPVLELISSDKSDGTYKKDDAITIQARFSDSVKVTGVPRLKICYTSNTNQTDAYAVYTSGTNTNTLTFTFTVPENATSSKLHCGGIDLNSGSILIASAGSGNAELSIPTGCNLQDNNRIEIDGIVPKINKITMKIPETVQKNADDNYYLSANKEILLILECDDYISISGNPTLKMKAGTNDIKFNFSALSGKIITFSHKVTENSKQGLLSYKESDFFDNTNLQMITDNHGNVLYLDTTKNEVITKYFIDSVKPSKPVITGLTNNTKYNVPQTLIINSLESGITHEYSLDGGSTWKTYTTTPAVMLTTGSHKVTARQIDKAGNISDYSDIYDVTIKDTFPEVTGISIAIADGNYSKDTEVDFKVYLEESVKVPSADSAILRFVPYGKTEANAETEKIKELKVTKAESGTNTLVFHYKVSATDEFNGVTITSVIFDKTTTNKVTDNYGNVASSTTDTKIASYLANEECNRENLIFDAVAPTILSNGYSPANSGVMAKNEDFKIELTFSEDIYAESGTVTLRLYDYESETWPVPPVLTGTEFSEIYDKVTTSTFKPYLIEKNGEYPKEDEITGMPVGPYKKMTHGLKVENGNFVPDTESKYVLAYENGIYDTSDTVKNIRKALREAKYEVHTLDINDVTISGSKVTISFDEVIKDGRHWELLISNNALRDDTGNSFAGLNSKDYHMWSNYVADPVVRVNRYSHGMGAMGYNTTSKKEVKIDGYALPTDKKNLPDSAKKTGSNGDGSKLAPIGYCNVRIDCETPGADVYYTVIAGGEKSMSDYSSFTNNGGNEDDSHKSDIADIAVASLKLTDGGTKYTQEFSVGDKSYITARKDYVTAYASKTGMEKSKNTTDTTPGSSGKEGIFKTTVIIYKTDNTNGSAALINIEGSTQKGGVPKVDAFPLRDATNDFRYSKNAYLFNSDSINRFAWVTYDIVTPYVILQHRSNYSSNYAKSSYGNLIYLYNYSTWE